MLNPVRACWKFNHGFASALLVAHGDRLAAPRRSVAGPPGLALEPPDIGLPADLDMELRAQFGSRHGTEIARQARRGHTAAGGGPRR